MGDLTSAADILSQRVEGEEKCGVVERLGKRSKKSN
jgi:hypothetical protein